MIGVVYFSLIFGENGLDNGVHYKLTKLQQLLPFLTPNCYL
jgi:hypothetical protein